MLQKREKRAFWLFLIWVLALPFMQHSNLAAQDDDFVLETEPAADAAPAGDAGAGAPVASAAPPDAASADVVADQAPAAGEPAAAAAGDISAPEDVVEETGEPAAEGEEPAAMPALSADPNVLLGKVNGLSKAGKHKEVIAELQEFEDAVVESTELLAIYVEALIKVDKPDWNTVNRVARVLGSKDSSSSLANYAQGLYWENAKKPDLGKAAASYSKAKSAKKPYPDAAKAYYMAMLKRFWYVLLLVAGLPVVVIVQKKKQQKAAKLAELSLDLSIPAADAVVNPDSGAVSEANAAVKDSDAGANGEKLHAEKESEKSPSEKSITKASDPATTAEASSAPAAPVTKKVVKVVRKVKAVAKPRESGDEPDESSEDDTPLPQIAQVRQPAAQPTYDSITAKRQAEIERIRELTKPERRPSVQADPELDALWGNLSRKALQGRIAPQYRRPESFAGSRGYSSTNVPGIGGKDSEPDFNTSDVTMDLSDEALRDDLIGKLKMLAITDGELREMFAMKNAAHIPHLIEYVMTRPEPLRLSFVARELGQYGDPAVIDTLASLLYHDDERVALAAIQGLENSKKPAAVIHLCPFLQAETPILAQAARTALSNFGAVKILQAFKTLPEHPDEKIRVAGVFVLSRMKGNAVEELLKRMLHDDSLEVRTKTILAMSYQKNPIFIDPLREFFRIATDADKSMARKAIVYLQGFSVRQK